MVTKMKECRLCKEVLDSVEFYKTRTECKKCTNAKCQKYRKETDYNKKYYDKDKEGQKKRRLESYYKDKNDPEKKLKWRCNQLQVKYNITLDDYNNQLKQQNYQCAICLTDTPVGNGFLHVDHDHATGKVRGLLCHHCNTSLGGFKDNVDTLNKAITYLNNGGVIK